VGELGLLGKNARTKEIPASVFELNNRQIGLMISRMWEGDGHVDEIGRSMFYATASYRMAQQLQHLLLRFGIISRLRTVEFPYKEGRVGYQLFITGYENFQKFAAHIGCHFISKKRRAVVEYLVSYVPPVKIGTKDIVPSSVKEHMRTAKNQSGLTWTQLSEITGVAPREFYPTNSAGKIGFRRNTLQRLGNYFDDPTIKKYAESDLYWDRIAYIEYVGEKQTYDLEIADTHNFIANDILVHNSHAADYGVIAVQTAYLKANYPTEYMTALLSASAGQIEKVAFYVSDAKSMGVPVLPIDINASGWDFEIENTKDKPSIRFGLGAVKNVGQAAVEVILKERDQNGAFKDLNDFARRADLRAVGKRALECLVKVGAMDLFGNRAALLASLDRIVAISNAHFRAADAGQMSLFGAVTGVVEEITLPEVNNVDKREMLNWERELIGLYISDHPLTPYQKTFAQIVSYFSGQLNEASHEEKVRVAGLITVVRPYMTKTNKPMGFVTIEDVQGNIELVLFPRTWAKTREQLTVGQIVIVEGKVDGNSTPPKILVDAVRTEIKILESLDDASSPLSATKPLPSQPKPASPSQPTPQPKPTPVTPLNIKSTQPKPMAQQQKSPPPPVMVPQVAEPTAVYASSDDMPPPPDNFPDGWDNEWQPSFEEGAIASKPEPKFKKSEEITPPRELVSPHLGGTEGGSVNVQVESQAEVLEQDEAAREAVVTSLKSIYTTLVKEEDQKHPPKQINVMLRSTGDKERDRRRIKTIYGTLISFHGRDRFSFQIFENGSGHLIDFPNDTTRVCPEMLDRLKKLIGEESWRVEEITFQ
jgi:DNA polymerase-3 subunit alpha